MKLSIVLAAVTLLVGLAVGYVLGSSQTGDAPRTETPPSAAPTPAAPAAESVAAERKPTSRHAASKEDVDLGRFDVVVPPAPTGDGVIKGSIVDADGKPVEGVLVRATPVGGDDDAADERVRGAAPPPIDVEREARRLIARLRRAEAGRREATTDAVGAYSLTGLGGPSYQVEAWLVGWEIERAGGRGWGPVAVGGRCDFKARQIHVVTASVLLPDGTPAHAARIEWRPASGGADAGSESATWKPDSPGIEVSPGTYEFTASANPGKTDGDGESNVIVYSGRRRLSVGDGDAVWKSEPQTVTIEAGASTTLSFQLKGRPGIYVKLSYASGVERPSAVRIAALKLDGGTPADPQKLLGESRVKARWLTDSEGVISGLEPGTYLVGATFRGGIVGPTTTASVGSNMTVVELKTTTDVRDWVKVRVLAPDGTPVRDVEFEAGCRGADGSGSGGLEVVPDEEGAYRVEHYEQGGPNFYRSSSTSNGGPGFGKRTYYVQATSRRYGTAESDYEPGKDAEVVIRMVEPARVRLTIAGYAASPDKGRVSVLLESKRDEASHRFRDDAEGQIDAAGVATFAAVRPGKYDVVLRLAKSESEHDRMNARWQGVEAGRLSADLPPGETQLSITLGALFDVVVTFEGETPSIAREGSSGGRLRGVVADGGGRATFSGLSPGRYLLTSSTGTMTADVSGPATIAFVPRPMNCFHLQVSERGYLHDLGLKTDDLVVAIDGVELTGRAQMEAALAATKARGRSTFTIQRDGRRFDVAADGTKFEEDDGSWYRPSTRP